MQAIFLRMEEAAAEECDSKILRSASEGACAERARQPASGGRLQNGRSLVVGRGFDVEQVRALLALVEAAG